MFGLFDGCSVCEFVEVFCGGGDDGVEPFGRECVFVRACVRVLMRGTEIFRRKKRRKMRENSKGSER